MRLLTRIYLRTSRLVNKLLALIEGFLFLRLLLKFLGASEKAFIVDLIYKGTDVLVSPFDFIFPNIYWPKDMLIETATLSAMIGYAILALLLYQLLRLLSGDQFI